MSSSAIKELENQITLEVANWIDSLRSVKKNETTPVKPVEDSGPPYFLKVNSRCRDGFYYGTDGSRSTNMVDHNELSLEIGHQVIHKVIQESPRECKSYGGVEVIADGIIPICCGGRNSAKHTYKLKSSEFGKVQPDPYLSLRLSMLTG